MLRIRFHGRGGQGMKTASRIVSTAAFREGLYAQDSPIYGAERRGARVAAFTRIADAPILERGVIPAADLIVIADETLLDDLQAQPLQGLSPTGTILSMDTPSIDYAVCKGCLICVEEYPTHTMHQVREADA